MKADRNNLTVLLCLCFVCLTVTLYSDDSVLIEDQISPDINIFQYYLDAADQRVLSEQWLDYARFGLESVLSSWEKEMLLLTGDDFDLADLRIEAEEQLNDVMQQRYADWLNDNFFNSAEPPSLGSLSSEIEALNELYLYETDELGKVTYKTTVDYSDVYTTDAMGNETLVKKGEKTLWVEGVRAKISELLETWTGTMTTAFSELKASVTDQTLLEELDNAYERDYGSYEQVYRDQLYRLYNTEQSRFTRLRLYDQYSLEYKSGQEAASNVSSELIAETEARLDSQLNALLGTLNAQVTAVDGSGGIINAEDWRESFTALLEEGMSSWDEAEQKLLMNRIEWEQDASTEVAAGEEAWAEAFYEMSEKRTEWMNEYIETLEEGNLLWSQENRDLEEAIEKAIAEIDENIAASEASLQSRIDNLIGMMLQSVNMMRTARTSWEYWMDRYDEGEKGSFVTSGIDYDAESMIEAMEAVRADLEAQNANDKYSSLAAYSGYDQEAMEHAVAWIDEEYGIYTDGLWAGGISAADKNKIFNSYAPYRSIHPFAGWSVRNRFFSAIDELCSTMAGLDEIPGMEGDVYDEAAYWAGLFGTYREYAINAQQSLAETYGIVVFDNASLQTAFSGDELSETLLDADVLLNQDAWEAIYLDEYQVELLKARAYLQYWRKQQEIAQAVYDYASDDSSTKETAEETAAALGEAKAAYDEVLAEYTSSLDRLSNISTDLESLQSGMETIQEEIDGYQQQLSDARAQYNSTITDLEVDNKEFLASQYREYYLQLLDSMGMTEESEGGPSSALEAYLLAAKEYGLEEEISLVSKKVVELLSGGENTNLDESLFNAETASVSELRKRMITTAGAGFIAGASTDEFFGFEGNGNAGDQFVAYLDDSLLLSASDYRYGQLIEFFAEYNDADTAAEEKARILWRMQIVVDGIQKQNTMYFELRLAELKLLTADDYSEWAGDYFGPEDAGTDPEQLFRMSETENLSGIIEIINQDLAVYVEILDLYQENTDADFSIYDWGSEGTDEPVQLSGLQAMQSLWDYKSGGSDAETASNLRVMADSLEALSAWIESLGSLEDDYSVLEQAILNPDEALGQQYLKAYLTGSHNLVTDSGDMHSIIYSDSVKQEAFRSSLLKILEENIDYAPSLSAYGHERAKNELLNALEQFGLINGQESFISPEAVWEGAGFPDTEAVAGFFAELDSAVYSLILPDYLSKTLFSYTSELKDYFAVKAASVFQTQLSGDLSAINEEIRTIAADLGDLNAVMLTLRKVSDDSVKLYNILTAEGLPEEFRQEAEKRFIETSGFDLATEALVQDGFTGTEEDWNALYADYISAVKTGLAQEAGVDNYRSMMLERAQELWKLSHDLADPESIDWSEASGEGLELYNAMVWNSLDFDDALEAITGTDSSLNIPVLEQLFVIDKLMPETAAGFPADVELEWLYGGNIVLREIDYMIANDLFDEWTADDFDVLAVIEDRYYADVERESFQQQLQLTAEDLDAGITVLQKAEVLWNTKFKNDLIAGDPEGLFRAFIGLQIINGAIDAAGEYRDDFAYGELVDEYTDGLSLSTADLSLLEAAVSGPQDALELRLDEYASLDRELLSGESLYWNIARNLGKSAGEPGYNPSSARETRVFEDMDAAVIISDWIYSFAEDDFAAYSDRFNQMMAGQIPEITGLAETVSGEVYRRISAFGIGGVLVEQAGYDKQLAAGLVNWFMEFKGLDYSLNQEELDEYLSLNNEKRFYSLLETDQDALVHYLKKETAAGSYNASGLQAVLDSIELSTEAESELAGLQRMFDDITVYNRLMHGEFEDYIDEKYSDEAQQRRIRELYMRFQGSSKPQWDDSIFMLPLGSTANASVILENLAYNRTRGYNDSGLNPQTSVSVNDVFINEALLGCYEVLYEGEKSLSSELSQLQSVRELNSRAAEFLDSLDTTDADNWRSFLNEEHLASDDDELNLVPDTTADQTSIDYERDLKIDDDGDLSAVNDFDVLTVFYGTGNDQHNQILDAANAYLDSAAYLTAAIESWRKPTEAALSTDLDLGADDFWSGLEAMSYGDIKDEYTYEIDATVESSYIAAGNGFFNLTARIESLKDSLSDIGYRRARLVRMSEMDSNEQIAELKPLSDKITELEGYIENAQSEWQDLIDGAGGYRSLEQDYAETYADVESAYKMLEVLKHEYSRARAVYQYASAGYLSIDDEILSEFDPVETDNGQNEAEDGENDSEVESGITGGTIVASDVDVEPKTDDQAYRDALLATINKVSPAERLFYINEKLARAAAANDALETIINGGTVKESVYSKDAVYRSYFDNYLETFRESLVLNKINLVLNKAIAKQEKATSDALSDWHTSINETYSTPVYLDGNGNSIVPEGLQGCNIDASGKITWGGSGSDAETFMNYFNAPDDSETGLSNYQNDLMTWLQKVSGLMSNGSAEATFSTWAQALLWEEYVDAGAPADLGNKFWTDFDYFNKNGDADLDREGARQKLIQSWQSAYNTVNAYMENSENEWLYNFYKMMDRAGIMGVNAGSTTGDSFETLDILGKNESIVIANRYMADEYKADAKSYYAAAVPLLVLGLAYIAAGTIALAIPFNWVAAIILFALGAIAILGSAHNFGEGRAKDAAAKYIEDNVIKPAQTNSRKFMQSFGRNTSSVLDKKQIYKDEFEKLQKMKGEAAEGETLTDTERIDLMKASTVAAFENEDENLHELLVQGGLVAENGNAAADDAALGALFGEYQGKMEQSEKDECVNSSLFINALEEEAQDYKQVSARELNDYLTGEDGAARAQAEAEEEYKSAYYRYLAEEITLEEFEAAAVAAYGDPSFSVREHMLRLYEKQAGIAEIVMGSDQFNAEISAELLESQQILLSGNGTRKGIYDYKMSNYRDVKVYELQMLKLEMNEKYRNWENQMRAISARGELEWTAGERKLTRKYREWQKETRRLYSRQSEDWDDKYLDFLGDKQTWLDAVTIQSTKTGDMDVLANFGEMTNASIAAAGADILVGDFSPTEVDPEQLSEVVDYKLLGTLLENAQSLNDSINDTGNIIFTAASPDSFTTADSLQSIKDFQSLQNEEYQKRLAEIEYTRMLEQVEAAEESFNESIEGANKNIDSNLNRTMRNDGYTRSGGRYEKELVVGATISDYVYEDGYVSTYNDYDPGDTNFGKELKEARSNVEILDSEGLQGLVSRAMKSIQRKLEQIFGEDEETNAEIVADLGLSASFNETSGSYTVIRDDKSTAEEPGILASVADWVAEKTGIDEMIGSVVDTLGLGGEATEDDGETTDPAAAELSPGYFGLHLGYAPGFSDTADLSEDWDAEGQIKHEGRGEMGRIMGQFVFNKMKEGAGWAEVNMPHYNKPLWEGEILGIEAPSAADMTSLLITVCTAGAGGAAGPLLSAAINLSDDIALSVMDVATGEKSLLEGAFSFGKTAAVSLAGAGFGEAAGALSNGADIGEQIFIQTGKQVATNTFSGAVNAIEYTDEGGLNYNWNTLEQSVAGESAIAGYVGSAVGTASTFGLNELNNSINTNGFHLGDLKLDQAQIGRVNSMIGGIAGEAAGALIDKDFTLNLVNLADIMALAGVDEANTADLGLFEVHMGIDDDGNFTSHNKIGTGGAQLSYRDILFDADSLFNNLARIQSINEDTAAAAANRDMMLGITERTIGLDELTFEGGSEVSLLLKSQLEGTRTEQSYNNIKALMQEKTGVINRSYLSAGNTGHIEGDSTMAVMMREMLESDRSDISRTNLIEMFGTEEGREQFAEDVLDANLRLAYNQGDIGTQEFMNNDIFDTTGSFSLAHELYSGAYGENVSAIVTLAAMFESGKAYAGTITDTEAQAKIISQKTELVNEYFKENIAAADAILGGDFFNAETHINTRIISNRMEQIENEMEVLAQASLAHQALTAGVTGYDGNTDTYEKTKFDELKANWLASAKAISELNDMSFNYKYAKMPKNPVTNADGSASSVVYGGTGVFTLYGWEVITPAMAEATGRPVYENRRHNAWDVSKTWAEEQKYGADEYFTAPETGSFDIKWDKKGKGIEIQITSADGLYQHGLGHNFTDSIDVMTELLILNGSTDVDTGTVIGKYQDYETNKSTGSHSHWEVVKLTSDGYINEYDAIDNNEWLRDRYGSNPYSVSEQTSIFSGKKDPGSVAHNMRLTRIHKSKEYWKYRSSQEFGVELSTEAQYLLYKKLMNGMMD